MSETAQTRELAGSIGPGLVIAGKYLLEQEIGRGSMGTVYRAVHVTLGTRFAIKLISSEHSQSLEARKRFSVEAKAAAKLRSRHVVQIYDDGETPEGNPYIVLEYLEGETLEQRIEREHDIPLTEAVRVSSHVGRALARAHAQGIVHRDLKPANIFLVRSDDDEVGWIAKVLDFGIAKLDHDEKGTTQAGTVLGTPLFMSPEQVRGASSVDHRADLYSMGMCLYHMLTGDFAFYRSNYSDILIGICTEPLPLLRAKAPWVPEAVERWFQRACAREPLERFQSADEMVEALTAAAGSPPLTKHKSTPDGRLAPETLVGYATPALVTQPGVAAPRVGQTVALEAASKTTPGHASPMSTEGRAGAPIAIAIGGPRGSGQGREQPQQSRSNSQLLWLGVGFGLLAIVSIALTLLWLGKDELPRAEGAPRPQTAAPSPAPARPATAATPIPAPAPEQQPDPAVSSVAAASATTTTSPKAKPARAKPAKAPNSTGAGPAGAPTSTRSAPAGPRPGGSDLGF